MSAASGGEPHQLFPHFWANAAGWLMLTFPRMGIDREQSEAMMRDLIERCTGIEPMLPSNPESEVHRQIGHLMMDAIEAEQRLFAATLGYFPGDKLGYWPASVVETTHPFLLAFERVVSAIEADANAAEAGRKVN